MEQPRGRPPKYHKAILAALSREAMRWKDIVDTTGIKGPSVSQALDTLVEAGKVERFIGVDGRVFYRITKKGGLDLAEGLGQTSGEFERKLKSNLVDMLREVTRDTEAYVERVFRSRPEGVKEIQLITIRNRFLEGVINEAWDGPVDVRYLIWWKYKMTAWEDGEKLFRISNAPSSIWEKKRKAKYKK